MPAKEKEIGHAVKGNIFRCTYCGNEVFSIEDIDVDLKESSSFLSPRQLTNIRGVADERFPSDMVELFCLRCGMSLGYKLVDRSGLIGDMNYIRVNMLELSNELQAVA
jgi:peptide methionine sulfoxide reductase MsrB